jgi:hypothetical protein
MFGNRDLEYVRRLPAKPLGWLRDVLVSSRTSRPGAVAGRAQCALTKVARGTGWNLRLSRSRTGVVAMRQDSSY